jgi:uncharacterized protein YndB with AHSA1/START domain
VGAEDSQPGTRVRLEKALPLPPERVFAAFVEAKQLQQWFGPVGFKVSGLELDVVEGRDYRIAIQPPEGDAFNIVGTFRTVEPPSLLAFTFLYEEPDPDDQETLVSVRFEAAGEGTRVVLEQAPFRTPARWALHRDGWTDSLERLAQALA